MPMTALITSVTAILKIMRGSIRSSLIKIKNSITQKSHKIKGGRRDFAVCGDFSQNISHFLLTYNVECGRMGDVIVDVGGIGMLRPSAENALENLPWSAEGARRRVAESLRPKDRAEKPFRYFSVLLWEYFSGLPLRAVIFYF
jgi:hypothetical protein